MDVEITDGLESVVDAVHKLHTRDIKSARFKCGRRYFKELRKLCQHSEYRNIDRDHLGFTLIGFPLDVSGDGGLELIK